MGCQLGFLLLERLLARGWGGSDEWGITVLVVLGGLQRGELLLLGTLLLVLLRERCLVRGRSRRAAGQ